ncbi:MAG: proton-conducting transporter membrane subunit, partial [Burkholderiaceae bacterium]
MVTLFSELPPLRALLLYAVPLLCLAAAIGSALTAVSAPVLWRMARWCTALAFVAALLSAAWLLADGAALARGPAWLHLGSAGTLHTSLRSDALGCLMLLLVSFIGWVIVGYSQPYLDGERGQRRYVRNLMLTLAAVMVLVTTNNLLLLALAWIATSLSLHGLLTFFGDRPQALIAAHKKFIASRVADLCLLGGIALLASTLGTLEIDQAIAAARALPGLTASLRVAALLLACSALLKCAQLPVHGWLIQVMEAPTPVSALLHAGVVNLGGFLLIRLGSLVGDVPAAQALLVVVGSVTAVVAA